jgi:serine/threonine-protein kinase
MHYAHELRDENGNPYGIVHRDVSPPNLFVTRDGWVKVLDFGIAKSSNSIVRTMTGQIRGKFSYMSPEQLRGHKLDRRSDVFALGIVLYEMLAARRLFRRTNRLNIFHAIVRDPLPAIQSFRKDMTPELIAVVERALARDREERYASAQDLANDLLRASAAYGGALPPAGIADVIMQQFGGEIAAKHEMCVAGSERSVPAPAETQSALPPLPHDVATITEIQNGPPPGMPAEWVDTEATTQEGHANRDTVVDGKRAPNRPPR